MSRTRVAVVMGGRSPEHEISLESGRAVMAALDRSRYRARAVVISREGRWTVHPDETDPPAGEALYEEGTPPEGAIGALRNWGADVAFLALHGPYGEDGSIQGFFRILDIPFTASGIRASAVALDKPLAKILVEAWGILTPEQIVVRREEWASNRKVLIERIKALAGLPCFVKAPRLGSSVGVFRVVDEEDLIVSVETLFEFEREVMAERLVEGREISCAVIGNAGGELTTLPPVAITPVGQEFFDYEAKYVPGRAEERCPAGLDEETEWNVRAAARSVHERVGARGFSRTDFILDDSGLWFLEINTIPGLTKQSIVPKAALEEGIGFSDLVGRIIGLALAEHRAAPPPSIAMEPRETKIGREKPAEREMG